MGALNGIYDEIVDKIATPSARLILLEILKNEGESERLIKACLKALDSFPDDISIRKLLAETYFEQGSIDLAKIELENISRKINNLSSVFKLQYEIFRKEERTEDAINSLKLYLAHNSQDKDAVQLLSELTASRKEEISVLPTATLAELYYKQGEVKEAIKIYEQVIRKFPDDEEAKERCNELKEIEKRKEFEKSEEAILKEKKLRLIKIFEGWLTTIEKRRIVNHSH